MNSYDANSFEKVSLILTERARELGANAFSIRNEIVPIEHVLDAVGPLPWALILHADAMARVLSIAPPHATNVLPVACMHNPDTPFGNESTVQPGILPMAVAIQFLDTALEHAICLGMRSLGYAPSEWMALPPSQQVPPLEPYLQDIQMNWVTEATDNGPSPEMLNVWPQLLDHERTEALMSNRGTLGTSSRALDFPSVR